MVYQTRKLPKRDAERKYVLGVDPGLGTTALVLLRNDVPLCAMAVHGPRAEAGLVEARAYMISLFCQEQAQKWVEKYEMDDLFINIELPYFDGKNGDRSVKTLMSQMILHGCLVSALTGLSDVEVHVGIVHNTTAKAVFTGDGNANKTKIISCSAWCKRPDVEAREHLGDAQAIGTCSPDYVWMSGVSDAGLRAAYVDSNLGKGKAWARRWPRGGRSLSWRQM